MPLIYFLRHGETDWNAASRVQGQIDVPLNDRGRSQAARNGRVLREAIRDPASLDFVASPLSRATETIEIVRGEMQLPRSGYRSDARLQEMHFGAWQGQCWHELVERFPEAIGAFERDRWNERAPGDGGENLAMLSARVMACLGEVTRDTVVVAHGGPMRCLRAAILALSPAELVALDVPQDKVLCIDGTALSWI